VDGPPAALLALVQPWASFYNDSTAAQVIVTFTHVAALLVAGGLAIAMDRATLRAFGLDAAARSAHLVELGRAHRTVVAGLVAIAVSGVLMATADLETLFPSWVYRSKMALVVLLLANGYWMTRLERRAATTDVDVWPSLRRTAVVSGTLWLLIVLLGVTLVNAP
jgi:hypothetical protein